MAKHGGMYKPGSHGNKSAGKLEKKPGGKWKGGGKAIPVDHGPRATGATKAGSGKTGFAKI
jgi:hypothetical protein